MRNVKILILLLLLLSSKIFSDCNNLIVTIPYSTGWGIDPTYLKCDHGKIESISNSQANLSDVNGGSYGPDCDLKLVPLSGKEVRTNRGAVQSSVIVEAQQDFCFMEAGDITFTNRDPSHYSIDYSKDGGSFATTAGKITIKSVLKK